MRPPARLAFKYAGNLDAWHAATPAEQRIADAPVPDVALVGTSRFVQQKACALYESPQLLCLAPSLLGRQLSLQLAHIALQVCHLQISPEPLLCGWK